MSEFIVQQLESVPGPKKPLGSNSTFILCPFHSEQTPSARVFHDNGYLRCYGCGASKAYSVWSKEYGLSRMGKDRLPEDGKVPKSRFLDKLLNNPTVDASAAEAESSARLEDIRFSEFDTNLASQLGVSRKWRGFSVRFLRDIIGARVAYREDIHRHYIWLPVWVRGRLRGFILATLKKPPKPLPAYYNAPGKWSLRYGLFPLDSAIFLMEEKGLTTIVVVEGPRDALRLLRMGIPAVSMLGTHSWTDTKSRMLELSGVKTVVLMMDGDSAGRKATSFLKTGKRLPTEEPVIKPLSTFFKVRTVKLWNYEVPEDFPEDAFDPGNMPTDLLSNIIQPLLS
jgi:hypothetical protein